MSGGDLLGEAVAELYSADPDEFIERRTGFVGQARAAGQPLAARQIAALRKPTRSAWVINQFARSEPESTSKLAALGERLRAAERSGDGVRMRELTQQRRQLIPALVRQALSVSGQSTAPAVMREEITATFAAALADPEVAEQIQHGTLLRAASRPGFGSSQAPLVLVPPLPGAVKGDAGKEKAKTLSAKPGPAAPAAPPSPRQSPSPRQASQERQSKLALAAERREAKLAEAAARAQAQAQERQAKLRAAAEQAVADADQAAAAAIQDERKQADTVRRLEHELTDARYRLRMAAAEVRRAETAQHKARQALDRLTD